MQQWGMIALVRHFSGFKPPFDQPPCQLSVSLFRYWQVFWFTIAVVKLMGDHTRMGEAGQERGCIMSLYWLVVSTVVISVNHISQNMCRI